MNVYPDFVLLLGIGIWISLIDAREFRIPDTHITLGFICVLLLGLLGALEPIHVLAGMAIALVQVSLIYWITKGGLGFGDVKYACFLGALLGPELWIYTGLMTGVVGLIVVMPDMIRGKMNRKGPIPFAPYLSCSALFIRMAIGSTS